MIISTVVNKPTRTDYRPMVNMSSSNNTTPRSINLNGSTSQQQYAPSTTATIPVARSTIDDFREIIREQSFIIPNNSDSNHLDVPIKKYPPLPDISVPQINTTSNPFFRTEASLINSGGNQPKKQIFNHFASSQRGQLPALNKRHGLPTISNVMDLDEDLPQCNTTIAHRAATYTSPGDRVISPIKRPSAPSPPASAQIKRPGQNAFVYGEEDQDEEDEENYSGLEDEDSQLFNAHFYRYNHQPITTINRRIDHYNPTNRYLNLHERQETFLFHNDHDEPAHPLDSIDLES